MAGAKKKKKPAANPARGFATTSIASKPKAVEKSEAESEAAPAVSSLQPSEASKAVTSEQKSSDAPATQQSPEDLEKNLEEFELQTLVEKYAQKCKRDASRQVARLQTDRRILRSQSNPLSTRKWLPPELMDEIMDLVMQDSRSAVESSTSARPLGEEDLTMRLWSLQQVLEGIGFSDEYTKVVLQHILQISDKIGPPGRDTIWGLEEALDWLARECPREELRDYDSAVRKPNAGLQSQTDTPVDTPTASGANTPTRRPDNRQPASILAKQQGKSGLSNDKEGFNTKSILALDYDSDIDPDDLVSTYLATKTKLFQLQPQQEKDMNIKKTPKRMNGATNKKEDQNPELSKLNRKLQKIESDVLFDKYLADQQWEPARIKLEKDAAAERASTAASRKSMQDSAESDNESEDEVSREAARIGAEMLAENGSDDDESALADLFASLPVTEVDAVTGKSSTVVNGSDGIKITIRDFGKFPGISPRRVLEEACRARDPSVKISYTLISDSSFSNRHSIRINWSKAQEITSNLPEPSDIECSATPRTVVLTMKSISTPNAAQSEAYIATATLFQIFSSSIREEKVFLRLPPAFRELYNEFASAKKEVMDASDRESIRRIRDGIRYKRDMEEEDGVVLRTAFKNRFSSHQRSESSGGEEKIARPFVTEEMLQRIWHEKSSSYAYQIMLQSRMQLPMWHFKEEVLTAIDREQVVIICGETGCGKSTQVPSFILEHQLSQGKPCKIYCTEPRRISAISLAKRVSEELGEHKGELGSPRSLVGYAIRLESNSSKETRLIYATTGIVMRMLEGSNDLKDITHIVLDEVHERTIDSDFLLIVLKKLMLRRPDLKVVLMSATVDADRFSKYLDGAPVLFVPGRTFPVEVRYLEDAVELTGYSIDNGQSQKYTDLDDDVDIDEDVNGTAKGDALKALRGYSARTRNTISQMDEYRIEFDLVTELISRIAYDPNYSRYSKAILVFLPGIAEIRQLNDMLSGHPAFGADWLIYPLHSTIASEDQESAFNVPSDGIRKIVLATNIAETGITIPDVTCVIDTGKHREMRFDERRQLSRLLETFISKANAKQRRGRAGRVQDGLCFHLFTKYRHDQIMADQQTPEMLRLSLQELAIRVKTCKLGGIEETLAEALDPPSTKNIRRAVDALIDVRALTAAEELTPLGQQLAKLPLDVFLGKLILLGAIFKCLDATITIAAILSSKSPFSAPFGARSQADTVRLAFKRADSDLLTVYNAYLAWKRVCQTQGNEFQFCRKNFLSIPTLSNIEDLKGQLIVSLVDSGFLPLTQAEKAQLQKSRFQSRKRIFFDLPQRSNYNADNDLVTQSVVAWSFYPKLLTRDGKGWRNVANNQSVSLHLSSVNKGQHDLSWLSFYHIMQTKGYYNAHETTSVEEFAIALLCGEVRCDMFAGVLTIDGNRAKFSVSDWKTMLVVKTLRAKLRDVLTKSFKNPGKGLSIQQQKWLDVWQKIFSQEWNNNHVPSTPAKR